MVKFEVGQTRSASHNELLRAGIDAVCHHGVDAVTVSNVTSITGHSRPTFYSYFGDVHGMFAELWITYGLTWLESQLEFNDEPMTDFEAKVDCAMVQVISVAHRIPEVQEIVVPDIQKWWRDKFGGNQYAQLRAAWIMGARLGIHISQAITPDVVLAEKVIPVLRAMPDSLDGHPLMKGLTPIENIEQMAPMLPQAQTIEDQLLEATAYVVASAGVAAASVARIARRCRVSTGTVYPRFATGATLIESAFDVAIQNIVRGNISHLAAHDLDADQYGVIVMAGLDDNRKVWRHYRLEMHLAAMCDEKLAELMRPGFNSTRALLVEESLNVGAIPDALVDPLTWFMQAHAVGIALLHDLGIPVKELDHRIMTRFISSAIAPAA